MGRFLVILGLTVAIGLSATAQSPPPTKQQKIEKILDATNPASAAADEVVGQIRGMLQQLQPSPSAAQDKKRREALDKISKIAFDRMLKIRPQLIKAYEDTFNDDEIDAMFAFYTSPAGRAATQKMPAANQRMSSLVQAEMDTLGKEINKIAEDSLR